MAANTVPIFVNVPHNEWGANVTAANTAMDGTGTVTTCFVADATDGSFVNKLIVRALGTCTASVIRVFMNNGSTNTTAGNNVLIADVSLAATTASNIAALNPIEIPLNLVMKPGYKLNITLGTAVSAGYAVSAHGGDY